MGEILKGLLGRADLDQKILESLPNTKAVTASVRSPSRWFCKNAPVFLGI